MVAVFVRWTVMAILFPPSRTTIIAQLVPLLKLSQKLNDIVFEPLLILPDFEEKTIS